MKLDPLNFLAGCMAEHLSREHTDDVERFCNDAAEKLRVEFQRLISCGKMPYEEAKQLQDVIERITIVLAGIRNAALSGRSSGTREVHH